jgi:hypothetical protein
VRALVPVALGVAVLAVAPPAIAAFQDSAVATAGYTTAQLAAPTGLTATAGCSGVAAPKVTLGWTATTTAFATGYDIYRAVGAGSSTLLTSVSPRTTVAYTDNAVSLLTSYTYTVKTRYAAWTKASATASATTALVCL